MLLRLSALSVVLALAQPAWAQNEPPRASAAQKPTTSAKPPKLAKPAKPASAAAAPAAPGAAPAAAGGPCLGVVPVISMLSVWKWPVLLSPGASKSFPVGAWGLDDLVVARVRAAAGPRVAVRKIVVPPATMAAIDKVKMGMFSDPNGELAPILQKAVGHAGCQRYLVVKRGRGSIGGQISYVFNGLALINTNNPIQAKTFVAASSDIRLFDGKTFAAIGSTVGQEGGTFAALWSGERLTNSNAPNRQLKDFVWPDNLDAALTPAARDAIRSLLAATLDNALPELLAR